MIEAVKGLKTVNAIASEMGVHPTQVTQWKKQALESLPDVFSSRRGQSQKEQEDLTGTLYQQIGQLKVELDGLKKIRSCPLRWAGIAISHDGKGRALGNIFVERLWRSVKYEEVYLKDYGSVAIAIENLGAYFQFYNNRRLHQSLDYKTPATIHFGYQG